MSTQGKKETIKKQILYCQLINMQSQNLGVSVQYKCTANSLILRICMTEKPFVHKKAFSDVETNFMYHETLAKNLVKIDR